MRSRACQTRRFASQHGTLSSIQLSIQLRVASCADPDAWEGAEARAAAFARMRAAPFPPAGRGRGGLTYGNSRRRATVERAEELAVDGVLCAATTAALSQNSAVAYL